jgi:hypothetical protein
MIEISLDLREAVRTQLDIDLGALEHWHHSLCWLQRELDRALITEEKAGREVSEALVDTLDQVSDDLILTADEVEELIKALVQSVNCTPAAKRRVV